jgi:DNA polymerase I-like protein with 3'-5' exonuclease and polymerase domains
MISLDRFNGCSVVALDFETGQIDEGQKGNMTLFSVAGRLKGKLIAGAYEPKDFKKFWKQNKNKRFVFHNAKFDLVVCLSEGIDIHKVKFEDTLIMAHLLDENRRIALKELRQTELGLPQRKTWEEVDRENLKEYMEYATDDASDTLLLYEKFLPMMESEGLNTAYALEKAVIYPIIDMELHGVKIDIPLLQRQKVIVADYVNKLKITLDKMVGYEINPGSSPQVSYHLFEVLNYPIRKDWYTKGGKPSARAEVLEVVKEDKNERKAREFAHTVLEHRLYSKLLSTFLVGLEEKVDVDGYVFANFNALGAVTGRFSCARPNLQQVPKNPLDENDLDTHVRSLFVCEGDEYIITADYSQIELRIMAELSHDEKMTKAFLNDEDLHQLTADALGIDRDGGKTLNFGVGYGLSAGAFAKRTGVSFNAAQQYINAFWSTYWGLANFFEKIIKVSQEICFVRTMSGRKRHFVATDYGTDRQAKNTIIQGCIEGNMRLRVKGEGYKKIKDVSGRKITLWDGTKFVEADVVSSGVKRLVEIDFYGGKKIKCSLDHKFKVITPQGNYSWKTVKELSKLKNPHLLASNICKDAFKRSNIPEGYTIPHYKAPKGVANVNRYSVEDIKGDFKRGVFIGRVVSDGSILDRAIYLLVAEHEKEIAPILEEILKVFRYRKVVLCRDNKQKMIQYSISSVMLGRQLQGVRIKSCIPEELFSNRELLRGFLCGMFDGDGTVSGSSGITLTFGRIHFYREYAEDIQKALNIFGIRSRISFCADRINVNIQKRDCLLFKKEIGFLKKSKNTRIQDVGAIKDWKYGRNYRIKKIKITSEYVPMFDVVNSPTEQFMVEDLIAHNSAADLIKAALVKTYGYLDHSRAHFIMTVHDEISIIAKKNYAEEVKEILKYCMEHIVESYVPFLAKVKIGSKWSENK